MTKRIRSGKIALAPITILSGNEYSGQKINDMRGKIDVCETAK
jgi:hypothetical protein